MKKILIVVLISIMILSGCSAIDLESNIISNTTYDPNEIGGDDTCTIHSGYYHMIASALIDLVPKEQHDTWMANDQQERKINPDYDSGVVNYILDNGITEQDLLNVFAADAGGSLKAMYPVEIIFSGDDKLIQDYYSIENDKHITDLINNGFNKMFDENINLLKRLFDEGEYNNSLYAFSPVMTSIVKEGKDVFFTWLKKNIDTLPTLIDYIEYYRISKEEFEEMVDLYNKDQADENPNKQKADINIDVIFSGKQDEIDKYYNSTIGKNSSNDDIDFSYYDWYGR